jgi:hypothetical protein
VCVEGKRMKAKLTDSSLCELFSPSGKITGKSVKKTIEEIKTMRFNELNDTVTKDLFSKVKELMKENEDNSEVYFLLTLLVEEVAYKGATHITLPDMNHFYPNFSEAKCDAEFESRIEKQQEKEKEKEKPKAKEKKEQKENGKDKIRFVRKGNERPNLLFLHSALAYSLMMKGFTLDDSPMLLILSTLLSSLTVPPHSREERECQSHIFLAFCCLSEGSYPFFSSLVSPVSCFFSHFQEMKTLSGSLG